MFSNELSWTMNTHSDTMSNDFTTGNTSNDFTTGNTSNAINSLQVYNDFMFTHHLIPSFVYIILLMIVGIPGNIFVCFYYLTKRRNYDTNRNRHRKQYKVKTSDIFILALACFDLISCSIAMPIELVLLRSYAMFDHPSLCIFSRYVSMFCTTSTSFVLLAIAFSRFFGIKMHFGNVHVTPVHAKIIVLISVVTAVILSFPMILLYGTYSFKLPGLSEPAHTCLISNEYADSKYPFILTIFLSVFHVLFDVLFFSLYGLISSKVVHSKRNTSTMINRENSEQRKEKDEALQEKRLHSSTSNEDKSLNLQTSKNKSSDDVFSREPMILTKGHGKESQSKTKSVGRNRILSKQSDQIKSSFSRSFRRSTKSVRSGSDVNVHGRIYSAGRTTLMMFIVTLVFMVTFAPYCVIAFIRNITSADNYSTLTNVQKSVYQLFLRSYFLSSAVNPIIYNFMNRDFRCRCKTLLKKVFHKIFCKSNT